ncbi:MAG TPA: hypothetical protein VI818_03300 [Candidatus Thermoplasmatota archaeon]|nr:hypothetical protein [Candidatus Thermoplasmatota archaeon]
MVGTTVKGTLFAAAILVAAGCIELPDIQKQSVAQNGCELLTATTSYKDYSLVAASINCESGGVGSNEHRLTGCRQFESQSIVFAAGGQLTAGTVSVKVMDGAGNVAASSQILPSENGTGTSKVLGFSTSFTIETVRSPDFAGRFAASVTCRT